MSVRVSFWAVAVFVTAIFFSVMDSQNADVVFVMCLISNDS